MLLAAAALAGFVLFLIGLAYVPDREGPKHSLVRVTDYSSYLTGHEDTLSDALLWEAKVDRGFSRAEALVYTALRPQGLSRPALADSARHIVRAWRQQLWRARIVIAAAWAGSCALLGGMWLAIWAWLGARARSRSTQYL